MSVEPHTLLGFQITTTPDGITALVLHAHDPAAARIYSTVLDMPPHVADALRLAVGREIPHRPFGRLTQSDIKARHDAFAALVATTHPVSVDQP
ncbi:hypothetical protein ACIGBL_13560 [Streptomyces sp. NPDC085614]|uniref:hypothetical protein n=1 Tax=Streptomyces sp. NPDC085614 TaxID=3365733 RepID=UPI0037D490C2